MASTWLRQSWLSQVEAVGTLINRTPREVLSITELFLGFK